MAYRNHKAMWIASTASTVKPLEIALERGGDAFWLDARTLGHVVRPADDAPPQLLARTVKYSGDDASDLVLQEPYVVGDFPDVDVSNFKTSPDGLWLVFSADVYEDRDLSTVKKQDDAWSNRGTSALVYEETFVRYVCPALGLSCAYSHLTGTGTRIVCPSARRSSAFASRRAVTDIRLGTSSTPSSKILIM